MMRCNYYLTMVASTELDCHYHCCPAILMCVVCDMWDLKGLESLRSQTVLRSDARCVAVRSCYQPTVLNAWPVVQCLDVFSLVMFRYLWTVRCQQARSRYWLDSSRLTIDEREKIVPQPQQVFWIAKLWGSIASCVKCATRDPLFWAAKIVSESTPRTYGTAVSACEAWLEADAGV